MKGFHASLLLFTVMTSTLLIVPASHLVSIRSFPILQTLIPGIEEKAFSGNGWNNSSSSTSSSGNRTQSISAPTASASQKTGSSPVTPPPTSGSAQQEAAAKQTSIEKAEDSPTALEAALGTVKPPQPVVETCRASVSNLLTQNHTCSAAVSRANWLCLDTNPSIQSAMAMASSMMGVISATTSLNEQCKKNNQLITMLQAAMTAFNVACGSANALCGVACKKLASEFKETLVSCEPAAKQTPSLESALTGVRAASEELDKACDSYAMQLAAGAAGLVSYLVQARQSKSCDKSTQTTTDCSQNPNQSQCIDNVDCSKPENASYLKCICARQPRTSGCPGAPSSGETSSGSSSSSPNNPNNPNSALNSGPPNFSSSGGGEDGGSSFSSSSSGNSGGIVGGGSSGGSSGSGSTLSLGSSGSGGGGQGSDAKTSKTTDTSRLDTNILSGGDGGGSGGLWGRGGGSYGSSSSSSGKRSSGPYGAYMPGGTKDPGRYPAGTEGITPGGGKSNWEKINERYFEESPTLH